MIYTSTMQTPIGRLRFCASEAGISSIFHVNQQSSLDLSDWQESAEFHHLVQLQNELTEYFQGQRFEFNVPLALTTKATPFQQRVWAALRKIPYGATWSYSELAECINQPRAVRAVGAANGRNPLSILVPCHRVIGKNQTLTGYAGGIEQKQTLLDLERNSLLLAG